MENTTIAIPLELRNKLVSLKMQEKYKNIAELIEMLYIEYRKQKFREASDLFRKKLNESGMTFDELLKKSRKIREEIADEWYPD